MDLEKQLHSVQTEMYMYQNSQKQEEFTSYRTPHVSADPPPMESDLMDMLGMPQSGATWNKQFDSGQYVTCVLFVCLSARTECLLLFTCVYLCLLMFNSVYVLSE